MESIRQWLEEYILTEKSVLDAVKPGETDIRIGALREMFHNYRSMSIDQFREVMTTAHFSFYFADALSRMFQADYLYAGGSWKNYTFADTVPDFRDVDRYRMTEPGTLFLRREKQESTATYIADSEIHYGVDEFSRQFDVSWQAIMNDDLGKIRETPSRMAKAAARFEDAFVSALYDNATYQGTIAALGAPWAITGRLTAPNLAIGINAMAVRTDALGNLMNINNIYLVIPPILEPQANVLLESLLMPGVATNDKNVLPRYIKGVYVDPYIATAAPNVPWYLFAAPSEIAAVSVARLNGAPGPWVYKRASNIEMVQGAAPAQFLLGNFETGDIEYAVEDIIGGWDSGTLAGVTDFRGMLYSSGTTA